MKFFILAAFLTVSLASEQICPRACPTVYDPVCGKTTNGNTKTFQNLCELQMQNCKHQNTGYELMKSGECLDKKCPTECMNVYEPICAKSGDGELVTFTNMCEFTKYACKTGNTNLQVLEKGVCSVETKKNECPAACTTDFKPVCAKSTNGDMKTFSNMCEFKMFTCQTGNTDFKILEKGICSVETKKNECPDACATVFEPVCAKSTTGYMKSFSNMCEFKMFTCQTGNTDFKILEKGICSEESKKFECPEACATVFYPVCAKSTNGYMKTFSNLCEFKMFKCQTRNTDFKILEKGVCSVESKKFECSAACATVFEPVCAKSTNGDMKTFSNMCEFKKFACLTGNTNLKVLEKGVCSVEKKIADCPRACTTVFEPVCAKSTNGDMKTFSNMCEFKMFTCQIGNVDFKVLEKGVCSVATKKNECPKACPTYFEPLCAKSGDGELVTFTNMCEFTKYTCQTENTDLQVLEKGVCPIKTKKNECPRTCTTVFEPICTKASNGDMKTFSNMCEFKKFTCLTGNTDFQVLEKGVCSVEKKNINCPISCPDVFKPVCTKTSMGNLLTFTNMCEYKKFTCQNRNTEIKLLKKGVCSE